MRATATVTTLGWATTTATPYRMVIAMMTVTMMVLSTAAVMAWAVARQAQTQNLRPVRVRSSSQRRTPRSS